jgi:hypothetical protein
MWYFAYGSNMQSGTLRGRRGVEYIRGVPARMPGWQVVFDKPSLIRMGHSFANVVPAPGEEVLGVLFEIHDTDLERVELTEGVLVGNYRRVEVEVHPLVRGEPELDGSVAAFTLASDRREPGLMPSLVYMDLVIEGAIEHGLPVPAEPESEEAAQFRRLLDEALRHGR